MSSIKSGAKIWPRRVDTVTVAAPKLAPKTFSLNPTDAATFGKVNVGGESGIKNVCRTLGPSSAHKNKREREVSGNDERKRSRVRGRGAQQRQQPSFLHSEAAANYRTTKHPEKHSGT